MTAFVGTHRAAKNSDWLKLPDGWRLLRLKWTIQTLKNGTWGTDPTGDDDDIRCVRVADFDRTALKAKRAIPTVRSVGQRDRQGRLLIKGDLLFEKSGGGEKQPVGQVVLFDNPETAVCSNFVARMAVSKGHHPRFLTYLHACLYDARVNTRSIKQTTGIQNISAQQYLDEVVAVPRFELQHAIADYLDAETARIDALIEAKENLLTILAEKRRAVITQAVTRGLDPSVPMRDSEIPWLGDIPAHWEDIKLRFLVDEIEQGWSPQADSREPTPDEWGVLKLNAISQGEFNPTASKAMPSELTPRFEYEVKNGDFLITRANTPSRVGDACFVAATPPRRMLCDLIYRLSLQGNRIHGRYLAYFLVLPIGRTQIEVDARGTSNSMVKISQAHIKGWRIPLPPIAEQETIINSLSTEVCALDEMKQATIRTVDLLRERRQAVIAAAVTGQLDVGAA